MIRKITFILSLFFTMVHAQNVAIDFDGVDDFVNTNIYGPSGNTSRTVEAWIKTTKNSLPTGSGGLGQSVIVDWGNGSPNGSRFTFCLLWNNAIRLEVAGNGLSGTIPVNDGIWHHVAVTYDAVASTNKVKLYVDGVLDAQGNLTVAVNTATTNPIFIGKRTDNTSFFDGSIDDVRVYNVARDSTSIYNDFNQQLCNYPTDLLYYFKLNEGIADGNNLSNSSVKEYVNNTNGGVMYNFAWSGTTSNWVTGAGLSGGDTYGTMNVELCDGDTLLSPSGSNFYAQGSYLDTIANSNGCDSVITINLTVLSPISVTFDTAACESLTLNGNTYTASTSIVDTFYYPGGCDSLYVTYNITINNSASSSETISVCDSVEIGGVWYSSNQQVDQTFTAQNGCDSIHSITVVISGNSVHTSETISSCDSVEYNGSWYTSSQNLVENFTAQNACDSIHTISLVVSGNSVSTSETIEACDSAEINGVWYTQSQAITLQGTTAAGCDSTHTLDLVVKNVDNMVTVTVLTAGGNSLSANQENASYEWFDCNDSISTGLTSQSIQSGQLPIGDYYVQVSLDGCVSYSDCYSLLSGTAIKGVFNSTFVLYPNPSADNLIIDLGASAKANAYEIFNVVGKVVLKDALENQNVFEVNHNLESGLYYIVIETNEGKYAKQFMVK